MKLKSCILLSLALSVVLLFSCKSTETDSESLSYNGRILTEQLTQTKFDTSKALEEMSRERTNNKIPFTMNFEGCLGKPVIDFDSDYHVYMQVDTGCTRNWYFPSFLAKFDIQKDYFIQCIINNIRQNEPDISEAHPDDKELSHFLEEEWSKYNLNHLAQIYYNDLPLRYDTVLQESFDGVLGEDFLIQFERVTFDYINHYIILNDEKLEGSHIPFILTPNNEILIYFEYNGQNELAMIDTGNYGFTPRLNIGDGNQDYDINDYSNYGIGSSATPPETPRIMHTYNNIKIGNITYNKIKGAYSTIKGSGYNKGSQLHLMKLNNLGNVFFYEHVIQFDFINKELIIK